MNLAWKVKRDFHLHRGRVEPVAKSVQCGSQNYVNTLPLVISISASASDESFFISTAESALAGIAALVPVGSAPELSHKRIASQDARKKRPAAVRVFC